MHTLTSCMHSMSRWLGSARASHRASSWPGWQHPNPDLSRTVTLTLAGGQDRLPARVPAEDRAAWCDPTLTPTHTLTLTPTLTRHPSPYPSPYPYPVLIFCESKTDVDDIHEYLMLKGVEAVSS